MKKLYFILPGIMLLSACTVTIPMQTNLSDQTMLLAENRNIKANYSLVSDVNDGYIQYISVMKNGTESYKNSSFKYASATAFKELWDSYFSSKFNNLSNDQMDIQVVLTDLKLRDQTTTSRGFSALTGNTKVVAGAIANVKVVIGYNGKKYETEFEVSASDYNEAQQVSDGNTTYTVIQTNPTQQKAILLDNCLNKTIIQFENYLRSVMLTERGNN